MLELGDLGWAAGSLQRSLRSAVIGGIGLLQLASIGAILASSEVASAFGRWAAPEGWDATVQSIEGLDIVEVVR